MHGPSHRPHRFRPGFQLGRRELLVATAAAGTFGCRAAAKPASELDGRFAQLNDQSGAYTPIQPAERAARRARLGRLLAEHGLDAYVCEAGATLTHLAGVSWGRSERLFGLVVLADGSHFWICPAFEEGKARLTVTGEEGSGPGGEIVVWQEHEYAWPALAAALRARGAQRIAVDPETRFFIAERLQHELGADRVASGAQALIELRGIKDDHELELLRGASELTQRALVAVADHVRPGMTGADVSELVHAAQRRLGLQSTWALCLVGPAAAYPHGTSDAVELGRGDFVLVDTGGSLHGYQSDTTRTWSVGGPPSERAARAWHAVRDAQQRAFEAIRPGVACAEIDRVARASLEQAGYGSGYELFTHRLGHGIGLQGHEAPYFDGGSQVVLRPGMTFSDEPGLYFEGELGVRLEDIVVVTAAGADHFGSWQAAPEAPA